MQVKTARHTLGTTEDMTLDDARSRALAVPDQIKRGIAPNAPPPDPSADAGAWMVRRMFAEYGADMRARGCVEMSIEDMTERLDRYLPTWGDTPITDVKRSTARDEHRRSTDKHGATTANKAMRDFRAAYNFALKVVDDPDAPPGNPVAAVTFNKERASNRVIMPDDLADWWRRLTIGSALVIDAAAKAAIAAGVVRADATAKTKMNICAMKVAIPSPTTSGPISRAALT